MHLDFSSRFVAGTYPNVALTQFRMLLLAEYNPSDCWCTVHACAWRKKTHKNVSKFSRDSLC